MHSVCKSIATASLTPSSAVLPITASVYVTSRIGGFRRFFSASSYALFSRTSSIARSHRDIFSSTHLAPPYRRSELHLSLVCKYSGSEYNRLRFTRGFKSPPKKNALRHPASTSSSNCLTKVKGSFKPEQAQTNHDSKSSVHRKGSSKPALAQKGGFSRSIQAEPRRPLKPVQAKSSSTKNDGADKAGMGRNSNRLAQKGVVIDDLEDSDELEEEFGEDDFEEEEEEEEEEDDFVSLDDEDEEDFNDELVQEEGDADEDILNGDDEYFIDDMLEEEGDGDEDIVLGDGADGGGVNIGQTKWGEKALSIAKEVVAEFGDNFSLYAFKATSESRIYVRVDKHSDKYGSPTMDEIEKFSSIYGERLEAAGQTGAVPDNIDLEVSSPGAERVVEVPDQLIRFKGLPMFVRYEEVSDNEDRTSYPVVKDSILEFVSLDPELGKSVWKLANVRANREQAGKGRGLTKKQKEWRMDLPLSSLRLVRLFMDI